MYQHQDNSLLTVPFIFYMQHHTDTIYFNAKSWKCVECKIRHKVVKKNCVKNVFEKAFINTYYVWIEKKHDDVIEWKHFPRHWPFVWGIHRWLVNSPHKGQGRGALMLSLICAWTNGWVNNGEAGDLRRHRAHYDVTVLYCFHFSLL